MDRVSNTWMGVLAAGIAAYVGYRVLNEKQTSQPTPQPTIPGLGDLSMVPQIGLTPSGGFEQTFMLPNPASPASPRAEIPQTNEFKPPVIQAPTIQSPVIQPPGGIRRG